ncbi:MAG TPA: hypothetical protein VFV81_09605 [Verrucomicrobiae bacterium]|nr:hypothetical protein [Verrucomicrobiae bacterium]
MKILMAIACGIVLLSTSGCIIVHPHHRDVIVAPPPAPAVVVPEHDHDDDHD